MDLSELYKDKLATPCHSFCTGCSILGTDKSFYSHTDYDDLGQSDVLVVTDSFKQSKGEITALKPLEKSMIDKYIGYPYVSTAAVKCPNVKEADMKTKDRNLCRQHLDSTIDVVKPKLVLAFGNLAFKMLTKKSGISNKRGKAFEEVSPNGHPYVVVPTYHPFVVYKEPSHEQLFAADLQVSIQKYVHGESTVCKFKKEFVMTGEQLKIAREALSKLPIVIGVDIETTGLNFRTDTIQTVSISTDAKTWVFPVDHKDSPFKNNTSQVLEVLEAILENPRNIKAFQNAKFDMKFLIRYGIAPFKVWDTKLMHHFINENDNNSLMDMVRTYFPMEEI